MIHNIRAERHRVRAEGYWTVRADGPVLVSDPMKLRFLLGLPVNPNISEGDRYIPIGIVTSLERRLSIGARRELQRILSGSSELFSDAFSNLVVNTGLNGLLDVMLKGGTQDSTWFVGLTDGTPTVSAEDTISTHAGWVEVTAYDEAERQPWTGGTVSGQSVSNTASPAVFTIGTNDTTVGGAFLCGANLGTGSPLYAAGPFSGGDRILDDADTLTITATFTSAAV